LLPARLLRRPPRAARPAVWRRWRRPGPSVRSPPLTPVPGLPHPQGFYPAAPSSLRSYPLLSYGDPSRHRQFLMPHMESKSWISTSCRRRATIAHSPASPRRWHPASRIESSKSICCLVTNCFQYVSRGFFTHSRRQPPFSSSETVIQIKELH
jgi:hypothetical protein